MSTQTKTNQTMNHKYPQPLANLPEQIVTAERLIKHIEEEQEVSIWDVAYEYMQQVYPNGSPNNLAGVGEQVVEKLKQHPSLWYNSPNYSCIGEYRVQGYEWMKFIWHIRYVCQVCQNPVSEDKESDEEEVEETTSTAAAAPTESGYSKQQFQKLVSGMKKFVSTTASVAEFMETSPSDLINVTKDVVSSLRGSNEEFDSVYGQLSDDDHNTFHETMSSMLWAMMPKVQEEQFKQFLNTTLINFVVSEQFTALKGQQMPLQGKMGKAKGLYFKWINQASEHAPIFKLLTKNQKSKLTAKMSEAIKAEFENDTVEMTVQKAPSSPSPPPPSPQKEAEAEAKVDEPVVERQITPEPKTPPIEELIGERSRTQPPLMNQPPMKKVRFDEPPHLTHLDLASSPASDCSENVEPKAPVEVKSFSFSESEQKMVTSSEVVDESVSNSKALSSFERLTDKFLSLVMSNKTDESQESHESQESQEAVEPTVVVTQSE